MNIQKSLRFALISAVALTVIGSNAPSYASEDSSGIRGKAKEARQKLSDKIAEEIADLEVDKDFKLVDLELIDGVSNSLDYVYEVRPSYIDNLYTRVDRIRLTNSLNPAKLIDVDTPLGLNLSANSEVTYVRQLEDQKEALVKMPAVFYLKKLPSTAQRAIDHMDVGDFVSLTSALNIVIGDSLAVNQGLVSANASASYVLSGNFDIRAFRLSNNRLRLQIFGQRSKGASAGAGISVGTEFDIFGIRLLDKKLNKVTSGEFLRFEASRGKNDLFMVDYILKLDDPDVARVYDGLIASSTRLKNLNRVKALNPTNSKSELQQLLRENILGFEEIRITDLENPKPRVTYNFKGNNSSKKRVRSFKVGLKKLARKEKQKTFRENHFELEDAKGNKSFYYMPTLMENENFKLLFGLWKEDGVLTVNTVFKEDQNQKIEDIVSLGVMYEFKDKEFNSSKLRWFAGTTQEDLEKTLIRNIPKYLRDQINWKQWKNSKGEFVDDQENARVVHEFFLHQKGFHFLIDQEFSREEIEVRLADFLASLVIEGAPATFFANPFSGENLKRSFSGTKNCRSKRVKESPGTANPNLAEKDPDDYVKTMTPYICELARDIHNLLGRDLSATERAQRFTELRKNPLFMRAGIGFIMSLYPEDKILDWIKIRLHWSAKGIPQPMKFEIGNNKTDQLYEAVLSIQSILNNKSFDMRVIRKTMDDDESSDSGNKPK